MTRAIKDIPAGLLSEYSMNGNIPIYEWFLDDSERDVSCNYKFDVVRNYRNQIRHRECHYYGQTDTWLYAAMEKFPLAGKRVLVFGSEGPLYELMAQEFGAKEVTVVEYNKRTDFDGIKYVTPDALGDEQFDCALSISSFEHDGLGRYGDPLDPSGDFKAMLRAKRNVVYGGNLFLAVPVGRDAFVWNACRVYGSLRLPLLLNSWAVQSSFGFSEIDCGKGFSTVTACSFHQPVFVLRRDQ